MPQGLAVVVEVSVGVGIAGVNVAAASSRREDSGRMPLLRKMLSNATILSIAQGVPDGAGDVAYSTGPALSVRCLATSPEELERFQTDATQQRGMLVVTVLTSFLSPALTKAGYPAGFVPKSGQVWSVQMDGAAAAAWRIEEASNVVKGPISHWRLAMQAFTTTPAELESTEFDTLTDEQFDALK
jgi:hypothetical protein